MRYPSDTKERTLEPIISKNLVVVAPDLGSQQAEEVIEILCSRLSEEGYVDDSYCQLVIEREKEFPTGLPTRPCAAAIPHAAGGGVFKTGLAIAVLNHRPVPFHAMDAPDEVLDVRIVILLAIADSGEQVPMLQWICTFMQNEDLVRELSSAASPAEVIDILKPLIDKQGVTE